MDFCPECGVAVEVRQENGEPVFVCRNPQCAQWNKTLSSGMKGGEKHG